MSSDPRMHILQMIEDGKVSAAEGLRLLEALASEGEGTDPVSGAAARPAAPPDPALNHWRKWWMIPLAFGAVVTVAAGLLMAWAYRAGGLGFGFACAAVPFLFGVLVMGLAATSHRAKWLHVRVKTGETEGAKLIALSFPLPIRATAWFLRTFGHFIPRLRDTGVDELILALAESTSSRHPLYVDVTEGSGGERVQVYIG